MNIAIIVDDLIQRGGQERLTAAVSEIWPSSPIFTTQASDYWKQYYHKRGVKVYTSFLEKLPFSEKLNRYYSPLFIHVLGIERFDFSAFDVVLSISSRYAHFISTKPSAIHGLEYITNNEFGGFSIKKLFHPYLIKYVIKTADKIVAPSTSTYDTIKNHLKIIEDNKIKIISEGVSDEYSQKNEKETTKILTTYGLEYKKYFLFVSTLQPRKNVVKLVEAFSLVKQGGLFKDLKLALVGKLGWSYNAITEAPYKYSVEHEVKFLHWIPQQDIPFLFSGSLGYVNLSIDEGFGLTVLEAMASKVPILVSDIPAHKEVGAEFVWYVDPQDANKAAGDMVKIARGGYPNTYLTGAGERAKYYSWENTAKKFIALFYSLVPH